LTDAPERRNVVIGGRSFKVSGRIPLDAPKHVLRVAETVKNTPDGELLTTADMLARAGYLRCPPGLFRHPMLAPFHFRYSYHVTLWGNKKEIAYVKKAAKSSGHV
jgi:hypothetical protein